MKNQERIYNYILESLEKKGALLFSLIDPLDHKGIEEIIKTTKNVEEVGGDLILVGGSTGVQGEFLDNVIKSIKQEVSLPIVLFPGNIGTVSKYADAIYFMSLLNSRNPYWITRAQMLAASYIKRIGVEPLSTAYVVVEPGGTVGWVGDVDLIPRNKAKIAAYFGEVAEIIGFKLYINDAGSNPSLGPIPPEFIREVRKSINLPYIVAGGIKTPEQAKNAVKAGADILQIGTAFEEDNSKRKIEALLKAIREEGRKRRGGN